MIEQAFARYGTPEIVNTDQGSQFTAEEFTEVVLAKSCRLSMDGRGAWRDNVVVERLWRSVKYERVYLKAYEGVSAARADIADYLGWYNADRSHSSLERLTPQEKYVISLPKLALAAQDEFRGASRVAHRVGRSSQATPAAVDNSAPCNPPGIHL